MTKKKVFILKDLKNRISAAKRKGEKVVFTNGCFDILHLGHIKYLEQAASLGDKLIVAVNSDASVRRLKGHKRPVFSQGDRARLVAALECVDYVTVFNAATPFNLIKAVRPDVLVKGGDWQNGNIVGKDVVESYGGKVKSCRFVKGYSTSSIIARIEAGR